MAPGSYYFIFSVLAVLICLTHIFNVIYFKKTGRNIMGDTAKPNDIGYKKYQRFASKQGLVIATILLFILSAHLIFAVHTMNKMPYVKSDKSLLLFWGLGATAFFVILLLVLRTTNIRNKR